MSLSDSEDDSSQDEREPTRKRTIQEDYNAFSTTSYGSSFNEDPDGPHYEHSKRRTLSYNEIDSKRDTRSSSENNSSPSDYSQSFEDNDDNKQFQDNHEKYYDKSSDQDTPDEATTGFFPSKVQNMMYTMGYVPGKGLGKLEDGRTEPVEASSQKGRRGLGFSATVPKLPEDFEYVEDGAFPQCKEEVSWMPTPPLEPVTRDELGEWLKKGPKKLTIDDETQFVAPNILKEILNAKNLFNTVHEEDFRRARFRSNPYETIGSVIFLNRAAVKMANLDAVFDYMFTAPKTPAGEHLTPDVLYFADVCAGPGGFSEYVLYRKKWRAKGFGFTLRGQNDFKLCDFYAGTSETFNPHYGENGDGDIFNPANLTSLKDDVLKNTEEQGVHFLMADGGFSVDGQENIQEILSKQLYLCQCLAALMLVRTGGSFVVKLFDIFTPFSVSLVYLMYRCFEKVSVHKPVTSRPANSERYLVCKWKRSATEPVENHLYSVNAWLWREKNSALDVIELVPMSYIQEDQGFFHYIYNSNCVIGAKQIKNLYKIAKYCKEEGLKDENQSEVRKECLKLWNIPDEVRTKPKRPHVDETFGMVLSTIKSKPPNRHNPQAFKSEILNKSPQLLESPQDLSVFNNVFTWHFMFLSSNNKSRDARFFLGHGGKDVYQLEGTRWCSVKDLNLTLPAKTLIYAEVVKELNDKVKMHNKAIHVIDAAMLGGVDISYLPLTQRLKQCSQFCLALGKPFDNPPLTLRCKRLHNMEHFTDIMTTLEIRDTKLSKNAVTYTILNRNNTDREIFHIVGSILFIKEPADPWEARMSRSHNQKYWFRQGKESKFEIPLEAAQDMFACYTSRVVWMWDPADSILNNSPRKELNRLKMEQFVHSNIKTIERR